MSSLNYDYFFNASHNPELINWLSGFKDKISYHSEAARHGHFPGWLAALNALPELPCKEIKLNTDIVTAIAADNAVQASIKDSLMQLSPWRKGPFNVANIFIDSEWKSYLKWNRIAPHLAPMHNRNVLDIGCGNGYYGYRMLGAGAKTVTGIDPGQLFCTQFLAINRFIASDQLAVLPLTGEQVFEQPFEFDTVFSMGVLSHRRQPFEHLQGLHRCLRPGGELVLETLVVDQAGVDSLIPTDRYANMRNIWDLPGIPRLLEQISAAGFSDPRCVDVTQTTTQEQRTTDWMSTYSLQQALDPNDPTRTIEGYPAPTRATVVASK